MTARSLQEASLLILTALASGSRHGYGIIRDVHQISGGRVRLRPGTLYTALDRLRAGGLVGVDREEVVRGRLHRYYRLIPAGGQPAGEHPATPADLRLGDADRETVVTALGEHFAQGRLTLDELMARLETAFTATTRGEIAQTTRDLPHLPPGPGAGHRCRPGAPRPRSG